MDSPDWRAAVARAKRLGIEVYQSGRVRFDPAAATTVLVEQVTSNEPWGPSSKDCAAIAELTFDTVEAPRVMEVRCAADPRLRRTRSPPAHTAGHLAPPQRRRGRGRQELAQNTQDAGAA